MAAYAANVLKAKKVGVIDDRTAFGQGLADEFAKEAQKLRHDGGRREFTTDKATDFMAILTTFRPNSPGHLLRRLRAPGSAHGAPDETAGRTTPKLLGGDTLCSPGWVSWAATP